MLRHVKEESDEVSSFRSECYYEPINVSVNFISSYSEQNSLINGYIKRMLYPVSIVIRTAITELIRNYNAVRNVISVMSPFQCLASYDMVSAGQQPPKLEDVDLEERCQDQACAWQSYSFIDHWSVSATAINYIIR
jgi:hypothetical protein